MNWAAKYNDVVFVLSDESLKDGDTFVFTNPDNPSEILRHDGRSFSPPLNIGKVEWTYTKDEVEEKDIRYIHRNVMVVFTDKNII